MFTSAQDPSQTTLFSAKEPDPPRYAVELLTTAGPISDVSLFMTRTRFGWTAFAENPLGLCAMAFDQERIGAASHVLKRFPVMKTIGEAGPHTLRALAILEYPLQPVNLSVVIKGTVFQEKVWRMLLEYHLGTHVTYGELARRLELRKGARVVGTAVASNVIAFFIPCHRVLNAGGASGHFRWGAELKKELLEWERALLTAAHS